jgi:hypothetical protein
VETWNLPPQAKIYEAMSAIADGRVKITGETSAAVTSSSYDKTYTVTWSEDFTRISSNDNASFWQGYLGYPIIAVLMVIGRLEYKHELTESLKGIPWKKINKEFKNDYNKAIKSVLVPLKDKGVDTDAFNDEVQRIMTQIQDLSLKKLPRKTRPPKDRS